MFDHHHHSLAASASGFFGNRILIRARVRSSEFGLEMEGENPIRNVNMSLIAMALQKTSFDLTKGWLVVVRCPKAGHSDLSVRYCGIFQIELSTQLFPLEWMFVWSTHKIKIIPLSTYVACICNKQNQFFKIFEFSFSNYGCYRVYQNVSVVWIFT